MWWRKKNTVERDLARLRKVEDSQLALLAAVTSTADAAHAVTTALKARLDDSIKQLEYTANILSDALIICHLDGTVESFNPAAERMFGWSSGEVVGGSISVLFRKGNGHKLESCAIWKCIEEQLPDQIEGHAAPLYCLRGKRRSGELFYVDGDVTYLERVDGSTIVMLLIKDITTRIELHKQLQVNESRYRNIVDSSFDGIMVVQNYFVVAANPAINSLLRYSPEETIAKPMITFVAPDYHSFMLEYHAMRLRGVATPRNFIAKFMRKDGTDVEVMVTSTLMQWEGKHASLIAMKDVTTIVKLIANRNQ